MVFSDPLRPKIKPNFNNYGKSIYKAKHKYKHSMDYTILNINKLPNPKTVIFSIMKPPMKCYKFTKKRPLKRYIFNDFDKMDDR